MTKTAAPSNRIRPNACFAALVLGLCALLTTAAARPGAVEKVAAIRGVYPVLESSGEVAFADLYFPDAARAEAWMGKRLLQKALTFKPLAEDRYGRTLIASDAEEAILRDGAAVAYSPAKIPENLLAAEAPARNGMRGVWADANLILSPEEAPEHLLEFHLVEGKLLHLYDSRRATYLNFGADKKTDFTARIARKYRRSFTQLDHLHKGDRVRVRGVLVEENGPMVHLTRPEQLEILSAAK